MNEVNNKILHILKRRIESSFFDILHFDIIEVMDFVNQIKYQWDLTNENMYIHMKIIDTINF